MQQVRGLLSVIDLDVVTNVRQNEGNPCVLAYSRDNGDTWTQFADLSLCPPKQYIYRYTDDGFNYQQSTNDGATWEDARTKDPRYISPRNKPRDGDNKRCNAAASVRVHMHAIMDSIIDILEGGGAAADIIVGIEAPSIIAGVGLPLYIFTQLAFAAVAIGGAAINGAFTEDAYHQYQCAVFCHMDDNGSISNDQYEALQADLGNFVSGLALAGFQFLDELYGGVGLSNLGTLYTAASGVDCSDCCPENECTVFDLTTSDYGFTHAPWTNAAGHSFNAAGHWESGVGIVADTPSSGVNWIGMKTRCTGLPGGGASFFWDFNINSICSVEWRDHATGDVIHSIYVANTTEGEHATEVFFGGLGGTDVDIYIGAATSDSVAPGHLISFEAHS